MSLREKQAIARRHQMLNAAEMLIRQDGTTEFSMRTLANVSEVSTATPYNFFGSKEGLLFALLSRSLKSFIDEGLVRSSEDPIAYAVDTANNAATILLRDPVFLRPLYQVMLGLTDPVHHPKFLKEAFFYYRAALEPANESKLFKSEQEKDALACSLMAHFMGVLDLWVHEDIDGEWFRAQLLYGFIHQLWPFAKGKSLKILQDRNEEVSKTLSKRRYRPSFFG